MNADRAGDRNARPLLRAMPVIRRAPVMLGIGSPTERLGSRSRDDAVDRRRRRPSRLLRRLRRARPRVARDRDRRAGRAVPVPAKVTRVFPGRAAGRDPALHAGARSAARLAARQPAGGMRIHAARHLRAARRSAASPAAATPPISKWCWRSSPTSSSTSARPAPTFVSLAERVQEQTGIPYALLDGRFDAIAHDLSQRSAR